MFTTATTLLLSLSIIFPLIIALLRGKIKNKSTLLATIKSIPQFYSPLKWPASLTIIIYTAYSILLLLPNWVPGWKQQTTQYLFVTEIVGIALFISLYYLIAKAITAICDACHQLPRTPRLKQLIIVVPLIDKILKIATALILFNTALGFLGIPTLWVDFISKLSRAVFIGIVGFLLLQLVNTIEILLVEKNQTKSSNSLDFRKTYTHIAIVKRILITSIMILTIAGMLMNFDSIRAIGTAALASAGVLATIAGLSAKGLLENLFKGIQLITTQPIRVNDTVRIENEIGTIEEINLQHVIVSLWDKREIIVPTGYFLDKPFQNWTHHSNELLGDIFFYTSYKMPIEPIRKEFYRLLEASELWNSTASGLYVSDLKNKMIELRLVVSASDVTQLANLRYEIREKLLDFMQKNYPEELP